jgi:hypothetical protein
VNLDGIEQTGNVYGGGAGVRIVYGGGAYKLEDSSFVGPVSLELRGAAANTAQLLESFGFLSRNGPPSGIPTAPTAVAPNEKNKPQVFKTRFNPQRSDMSSEFDGTKQ